MKNDGTVQYFGMLNLMKCHLNYEMRRFLFSAFWVRIGATSIISCKIFKFHKKKWQSIWNFVKISSLLLKLRTNVWIRILARRHVFFFIIIHSRMNRLWSLFPEKKIFLFVSIIISLPKFEQPVFESP